VGEKNWQMTNNLSIKQLVLESAARSNILPLISTCNVQCKFCSHRQNPPLTEALSMPPVNTGLVREALDLMDPKKPVVIGESVTRLMEGEPFLHPRIKEILTAIRERLPRAEIRVTTNGTMLDREMVLFLASLGGVTLCLSLNSADLRLRRYLMNDPRAETAISAAPLLSEAGVLYHGSVVAMPHLTGWADLALTLEFLHRHGAATARVLMPGYTGLAPAELRLPGDLRQRLHSFISDLRARLELPVTLDPPLIGDLQAEVAGVMAGSPAWRAGLKTGDIIRAVGGMPVKSRVDAFNRVLAARNPHLELSRGGPGVSFELAKDKGSLSGLVMDYDIDPDTISAIEREARRSKSGAALLITSELGCPLVKMGLDQLSSQGGEVRVRAVKNRFFGGSIGCAGLLTVADMLEVASSQPEGAGLIIAPAIAFDSRGRDITGRSYLDLAGEGGSPVLLL